MASNGLNNLSAADHDNRRSSEHDKEYAARCIRRVGAKVGAPSSDIELVLEMVGVSSVD